MFVPRAQRVKRQAARVRSDHVEDAVAFLLAAPDLVITIQSWQQARKNTLLLVFGRLQAVQFRVSRCRTDILFEPTHIKRIVLLQLGHDHSPSLKSAPNTDDPHLWQLLFSGKK